MKQIKRLIIVTLLVIAISGCTSNKANETPASVQNQPTEESQPVLQTDTQPAIQNSSEPTNEPSPSATLDPRQATDNPEVNATIAALLDQDLETLMERILLNSQPCTTQDGLGGPPKCPEGVNQGTVLSFFPVIGPGEGTYLNPDEVSRVFDYQDPVISAVIKAKPPEVYDLVFPRGNYAVILTIQPNGFARTFRLNDQGKILRVDYTAWDATQEIEGIEGILLYPPNNN